MSNLDPLIMPPDIVRRLNRVIRLEVWRRRLRRLLRPPLIVRVLLVSQDPECKNMIASVQPMTEEEVLELMRNSTERSQAEGE